MRMDSVGRPVAGDSLAGLPRLGDGRRVSPRAEMHGLDGPEQVVGLRRGTGSRLAAAAAEHLE